MIRQVSIFVLLFCFIFSFRSYSQAERDTVFYEIQPSQIEEARIAKSEMGEETNYRIFVQLKEDYHSKFAQLTGDNVGNFLAVTYKGDVLSDSFPVLQIKIKTGDFYIGPIKNKERATKILQQILGKDENK